MLKLVLFLVFFGQLLSVSGQTVLSNNPFGSQGVDELASSLKQLPNGDLLVLGYANAGVAGDYQYSLSRLSNQGILYWTKYYGTTQLDFGLNLQLSLVNTAIVCGEVKDELGGVNAFIAELDFDGNLLWQKQYGSDSLNESLKFIQVLPDGGLIACGYLTETRDTDPQNDILVMKFTNTGELSWQKQYGFGDNDYADGIRATADGGFILTGDVKQSANGRSDYDIYLLKIDSAGIQEWDLLVGDEKENGCQWILINSNGDYTVVGESTGKSGPGFDVTVVRVSPTGELIYLKKIESGGTDAAFSAVEIHPDTMLLAGYSNSGNPQLPLDVLLLAIDAEANELGRSYTGSDGIDIGYEIIYNASGELYVAGKTTIAGESQYLLVHGNKTLVSGLGNVSNKNNKVRLFPQPSSGNITLSFGTMQSDVKITIVDLAGKEVYQGNCQNAKDTNLQLDLTPGLYLIHLQMPDGLIVKPLLLR